MKPECYTTTQIVQISAVSSRQLTYWAKHNIVRPSIQPSNGPGTRRLYSFDDLLQIRFLLKLRELGWSVQKIRSAIVNLRVMMDDPDPLKSAMLGGGKKNILALYKTREGERHLAEVVTIGGQHVLSLALETIEEETHSALARFAGSGK